MKSAFVLESNAIKDRGRISAEHYWDCFGCTGDNVMPDLAWGNVPEEAKSFAVTFYDKDAPTGSGFWHWVVYDIPRSATSLPGGVNGGPLPVGAVEGNTDMGKPGFLGPCPPVGREHIYVYTVHALNVDKLPVEAGSTAALVGFALWQKTIAKASLKVVAGPRQ
jgi:Raf kinase inhibitor-like YbhB/YbcL family protein